MKKKHIVMLIIAVISMTIGVAGLVIELDLEDGQAVVSGSLAFEGAAVDPDVDLGLPFSYPLLSRTVQMAQYVKRGSVIKLELSASDPEARIKGKSGDKNVVYENPPFPKWIRRHAFFGNVIIDSESQKLRLHRRLVSKLYFSDSDNIERKTERYVVARKLVKDEQSWRDGKLIDRFEGTEDLSVGDIIVTWRSIRPASLAPAYTVYGRVHDAEIGDNDHDVDIFDRQMSLKEFEEAHFTSTGSRTFGKVFIVIGLILAVLSLLPKFRSKNEEAY